MKSKRTIIDTNLWISFLITNNFKELDNLIDKNQVILLFFIELIEEFLEVANRPKFKKYFVKEDVSLLMDQINSIGELVDVNSKSNICRDSKDNFLLNLSIDGDADYLITGDVDLIRVKKN